MLQTSALILEDNALEDYLQVWVVALTGLPSDMVRPRWQPEPPNIPDYGVDWCGLGVTSQKADTFTVELHNPTGVGYDELRRHEELTCSVSFYGPNSGGFALLLRDNMQLSQNLEYLTLQGMGLVESGNVMTVPELVKERWLKRKDIDFTLRRQIVRDYSVPSLLSAQGVLYNEHYTTPLVAP
jgi:hypothetical protein